jgi:hypothetical protein
MGFFSWKTADTDESIANVHTGNHKTVFLLQPDGAEPIEDRAYDGYGRFGGVGRPVTAVLPVEGVQSVNCSQLTSLWPGCRATKKAHTSCRNVWAARL